MKTRLSSTGTRAASWAARGATTITPPTRSGASSRWEYAPTSDPIQRLRSAPLQSGADLFFRRIPTQELVMESSLKQLVIVGGGAAGWMTAAALSRLLRPESVSITLVESDEIGIIGVGEATIPDMLQFNLFLGVAEAELMRATNATFKLGIEFVDWSRKGARYFHPFGFHGVDIDGLDFHQYWLRCRAHGHAHSIGDYCQTEIVAKKNRFGFPDTRVAGAPASYLRYAYHFDAALYAGFLRRYAEQRGVKRVEGKVCEVLRAPETGDLTGVRLADGRTVSGEFFFDCTGFRSLLLSSLGVPWVDWRHWLPCDAAL